VEPDIIADVPGDGQLATTDLVPPVIAPPDLEPGTRLGDRYRLIARLGQGGGGTVWRVFDEKVGEELALKLIEGGTDLERWRREVALARRISHGNVCRVYDLGEARGLRWVTMEWIEGESLRAVLRRGAVAAAERERLMHQLVDAVAAIHAAGVVHRDIKPENIVVDGAGRAVIVDFGLARRPLAGGSSDGRAGSGAREDRSVTGHGAVVGTPRYMAPEQAAGAPVDARSDVYALGLVLEEIATGSGATPVATTASTSTESGAATADAPPSSDDALAVATTVGAGAPVPVGQPGPGARPTPGERAAERRGSVLSELRTLDALPRPWPRVIVRCTARAAGDRFPDAVAVRTALSAPRRKQRQLVIAGVVVVAVATVAVLVRIGPRADDRGASAAPLAERRLTATAAAPANQPTSIAVSVDGKAFAYTVGIDLVVRAVDGGRDTPVTMPTTPGSLPLARTVEAVGFLGDGRVVAQILDRDHVWGLWALGPGREPQVLVRRDEHMIVAVSPRGDQIAVVTRAGLVAVPVAGGPERPLVAARAGERLGGPAWSPDTTRLAFVRQTVDDGSATLEALALAAPVATDVIARVRLVDPVDQMTAWPAAEHIVYATNDPDGGAALMAVALAASPGVPVTLVRWPAEYVAQLAAARGRLVVLRGTAERAIEVGSVDRRGYFLNLQRGVPEHARAGQLAGWTADGRLVHAADADVVVRALRGPATVLARGSPDAVVGDAVVYHRGAAIRTVGAGGGGDRALSEPANGSAGSELLADGNLVRCAGDRAPPCVIAALDLTAVRYLRFDPRTGAQGPELHRVARGARIPHAMALSPDGATLAVVDGSSAVTLVAVGGGRIQREALAPSARIEGVSWSRDGASLLLSVLAGGDDRASVIRLWPGGQRQLLLHSDQLRYGRIHEAPEGDAVAIQTRELALDAWLIDGL
jgi:serine/threonine-protein kinase